MKSARKIKQAYNQGLQVGYQTGVIKALEKFVELSSKVLKEDYNWTDDQLEEFSNKFMNQDSPKESSEQLSLFDEKEGTE